MFCSLKRHLYKKTALLKLHLLVIFDICYAAADATKMPTTHYDNNASAVVVS